MALSIAELRAKVAQQQSQQQSTTNYSSSIFSFSDLKPGDQVRIRFIDDNDEGNDLFWRTRCIRTLSFPALRLANGSVVDNKCYVDVPAFNRKPGDDKKHENDWCLPADYVYNSKDDVINTRIKPLWDGTSEGTALYNKFGRTVRRVFQGFIRSEGYETKLYRFVINPDLFNNIYSFMDDDEFEATPCDPINGREFLLKVSEKIASINGSTRAVKDYSTSKWSSKVSPLTDEENAWLANNSSYDLKNFIPSRPSIEQEKVMLEMFEASYNSEPYDVVKWGKIFKPNNVFFDEQGNIKDMKGGNTVMTNTKDITPSSVVSAPIVETSNTTTIVTPTVQPSFTPEQLQQMLVMAQQTPAQPVAQTVVPTPTSAPTAPQLINQHTVDVQGDNPSDVIANIMSKFNMPTV